MSKASISELIALMEKNDANFTRQMDLIDGLIEASKNTRREIFERRRLYRRALTKLKHGDRKEAKDIIEIDLKLLEQEQKRRRQRKPALKL